MATAPIMVRQGANVFIWCLVLECLGRLLEPPVHASFPGEHVTLHGSHEGPPGLPSWAPGCCGWIALSNLPLLSHSFVHSFVSWGSKAALLEGSMIWYMSKAGQLLEPATSEPVEWLAALWDL